MSVPSRTVPGHPHSPSGARRSTGPATRLVLVVDHDQHPPGVLALHQRQFPAELLRRQPRGDRCIVISNNHIRSDDRTSNYDNYAGTATAPGAQSAPHGTPGCGTAESTAARDLAPSGHSGRGAGAVLRAEAGPSFGSRRLASNDCGTSTASSGCTARRRCVAAAFYPGARDCVRESAAKRPRTSSTVQQHRCLAANISGQPNDEAI